jgi:glycine dehydrogenase
LFDGNLSFNSWCFESAIKEITQLIHDNGGQVYGWCQYECPSRIDKSCKYWLMSLNLHKTFAIPHGGGGPGVGPICVAPQLVPFLPTNPLIPTGGEKAITAISAPWFCWFA